MKGLSETDKIQMSQFPRTKEIGTLESERGGFEFRRS